MEDWKHCPEFAPLADLIRNYDSFAVVAHIHPDGDAIGSTLALGNALKNMGKHVVMMNEDGVPASLAFLPGVEDIISTPDEPVDAEVAISVDNGALKRLGNGACVPWPEPRCGRTSTTTRPMRGLGTCSAFCRMNAPRGRCFIIFSSTWEFPLLR